MDFEELLESLFNPGEDGVPDDMRDNLTASYQDATTTRDAKVAELESIIASQTSDIARLKSANYDLMVAAPAGAPADTENQDNDNDNDDDEEGPSVDDLFEEKE